MMMCKLLATAMAITMAALCQARDVDIKLLQTSDVHGNLFPFDFVTGEGVKGSLARVASLVDEYRPVYGDNIILLDNGDILQGQPTVYYYNYVDTVSPHVASQVLNYLRYDAGNVGNHDVETGRNNLERWARQCNMPILGANILNSETGEPHFPPYTVIERDGVRIAVLGMITPAIPVWLPKDLWEGLEFADMETTARKWIPIIQEREKPDMIIGLFHAGQAGNTLLDYKENPSLEIAEKVPGFDIVLMGHDHRQENTRIVNVAGDTVVVMDPANNAQTVTDLTLHFTLDNTGKVTGKSIDQSLTSLDNYEVEPAFREKFTPQRAVVRDYILEKIGHISRPLSIRNAYFGPSAFIDFIHTLQLAITGAEVSFTAPLALDITIPAGDIYMSDMFNLYKYENKLYVMELTGAEIKNYLEMSYDLWSNTMSSPDDHLLRFKDTPTKGDKSRSTLVNQTYNYDSAAGIIYNVDVTKPKGAKINIISMADGTPFDFNKVYKVAVNSYRGNGGGELLTVGAGIPHKELPSRIISSTDRDLRYYFTEYIRKHKDIVLEPLNQWQFIPEEIVAPAIKRDYEILFPSAQ